MVDLNTGVLGLVGYPLSHSISPLLHNHTIKEENLNYIYLPFPVEPEKFADALIGFRAINVRGLNLTIPYKEKVLPYLDRLDSLAARIGAVNTIVNDNGIFAGYNTDITGLARMIRDDGNFSIKDKKVLLIGAGGAARAAGISVLSEGAAKLYILNRTIDKGSKLVEEWKKFYPTVELKALPLDPLYYEPFIKEVDLLIDTTPVGMAPYSEVAPVISSEYLNKNMLVVDLVYNPRETSLLKAAKKAGAKCLNGMGMLIYQGIESFKLWTGYEINPRTWWNLV